MRQLLVASLRSRGPCGVSNRAPPKGVPTSSFISGIRRFSGGQKGAAFCSALKTLEGTQKAYYDLTGSIAVCLFFRYVAIPADQTTSCGCFLSRSNMGASDTSVAARRRCLCFWRGPVLGSSPCSVGYPYSESAENNVCMFALVFIYVSVYTLSAYGEGF